MPIDDTTITTRVKAALATDEMTGLLDVEVQTINGMVYLRGAVESEEKRLAAGRIAAALEGVRSVSNEIVILCLEPPVCERIDLTGTRPLGPEEGEEE